jgi:hypothetical protein
MQRRTGAVRAWAYPLTIVLMAQGDRGMAGCAVPMVRSTARTLAVLVGGASSTIGRVPGGLVVW